MQKKNHIASNKQIHAFVLLFVKYSLGINLDEIITNYNANAI